jgi:hypothetical protein
MVEMIIPENIVVAASFIYNSTAIVKQIATPIEINMPPKAIQNLHWLELFNGSMYQ